MELTPSQYKDIEQLAAINYSLKQIAMYLDVDEKQFTNAFHVQDSKIKYHFDRGLLMAQAEIDKANLKRARDGNQASIQQWKKDTTLQKLEHLKKKKIYENQKLELHQLQALIEKGEVHNLPEKVVQYYEQMDFIRAMFERYESKSFVINAVMLQWPDISKYHATNLYQDTLNFFNLDNKVKVEAWANIYADRLDNMAAICYEMNDFETARRLTMDAAEMRGVGKEKPPDIPQELLDRRPIFYTIRPEEIGVPREDRNKLGDLIDSLDIPEKEKTRVKREALIIDVPFEAVEDVPQEKPAP